MKRLRSCGQSERGVACLFIVLLPWQPPRALTPENVAAFTLACPLLVGALNVMSHWSGLGLFFLAMSGVVAAAARFSVRRRSRLAAVGVFGAIELPHFAWMLGEALRNPEYLLAPPPHALFFALPHVVFLGVALTDVADAGLIAIAWRAKEDASHEATDRFLAIAGAWLIVTGALRWPPLLAVLDLEDAWHGWPTPAPPVRGLAQIAIGATALAGAIRRLRARRAWLAGVEAGRSADFRVIVEGTASIRAPRMMPLLTRSGPPRLLARREPPSTTYREVITPIARMGDSTSNRSTPHAPGRGGTLSPRRSDAS